LRPMSPSWGNRAALAKTISSSNARWVHASPRRAETWSSRSSRRLYAAAAPTSPSDRLRPGDPAPLRRVGQAGRQGRRRLALPATSAHSRAVRTARRRAAEHAARPMPYRTLASVADITAGNQDQTLRILSELDPANAVRPRRGTAGSTMPSLDQHAPYPPTSGHARRTRRRVLKSLDEQGRQSLRLSPRSSRTTWSLDGLSHLVYRRSQGPAGFPPTRPPRTADARSRPQVLFALLYHLLVGPTPAPRLPTLLLAVGQRGAEAARGSNPRYDDRARRCSMHRAPSRRNDPRRSEEIRGIRGDPRKSEEIPGNLLTRCGLPGSPPCGVGEAVDIIGRRVRECVPCVPPRHP